MDFPAHDPVLARSRLWLERAVIGLNLCPFAKAVHVKRQVRYVVSHAPDEEAPCVYVPRVTPSF